MGQDVNVHSGLAIRRRVLQPASTPLWRFGSAFRVESEVREAWDGVSEDMALLKGAGPT